MTATPATVLGAFAPCRAELVNINSIDGFSHSKAGVGYEQDYFLSFFYHE